MLASLAVLTIALALAFPIGAQDTLAEDDPFSETAFDQAVAGGARADSGNRLEYLPGVFFVSEATGSVSPGDGSYGSDARFYGKAFVKATKADVGSLLLSANYSYFLYASADNPYYRALYRLQAPDPTKILARLSEFHFSFDAKKVVFVRIGSQLISWGATYFWSPEDFINLQKAQAEVLSVVDSRIGKPGLRLHIPLNRINVFLFTDFSGVIKNGSMGMLAETVGQAWRVDGIIGGMQIGMVGYARKGNPLQLGFDATTNILGADIYGEIALGIENTSHEPIDASFSIGASRLFGREKSWTARGEFYCNQRGYADTALSALPIGAFTPFYSGKYYVYAELSTQKFFSQIVGAGFFGYANIADRSYSTTTQFTFDFPGIPPFSVYCRYYGGINDREFTSPFGGRSIQAGLRIRAEF